MPLLPEVPAGCNELTEPMMDGILDLLNVLSYELPAAGLDVVACGGTGCLSSRSGLEQQRVPTDQLQAAWRAQCGRGIRAKH